MSKPRGWNLKAGQPDGDAGREKGASLGGQAVANRPAPPDCSLCQKNRYTTWQQHIGHMGFLATATKFGLTPEGLYRVLLALYQDPYPENGAWSGYLRKIAHDRKLGNLPEDLNDLLVEEEGDNGNT